MPRVAALEHDDTSLTLPRLRAPFFNESAKTTPYLRMPASDTARTTPYIRAARAPEPPNAIATPAPVSEPPRSGISDELVRRVHGRLADGGARATSLEQVGKLLRETEAKLRAQHGQHRKIDFAVLNVNGRAVIKPIVR